MFTQEQIVGFLLKCLWVGCGFVGGYIFTLVAGVGYDKLVARKPSPPFLHAWARRIGGVLVALLVAFFVFPGDKGPGPGGGGGSGQQGGEVPAGPTTPATTTKPPATDPKPEAVLADAVGVTVFAGAKVDKGTENYFAFTGDRGAIAVEDVMKEVRRRREKAAGVVIVYTFDATATKGTTGYELLDTEAKKENVPLLTAKEYATLHPKK